MFISLRSRFGLVSELNQPKRISTEEVSFLINLRKGPGFLGFPKSRTVAWIELALMDFEIVTASVAMWVSLGLCVFIQTVYYLSLSFSQRNVH